MPGSTDTLELEFRGAVGLLSDAVEDGNLPPEILISGAAGTGKTWGILMVLHLLSLRRPGLRILVCRKTREALTESVLVTYEQEVLPLTGHQSIAEGVKRRVRQSYVYPNGTEWIVGGLDKPSKILSTSYDLIFPNEAIEFLEEDWETFHSRIGRPERSHSLNCLVGDTNPGDPAHWLKVRVEAGRCLEWPSRHTDNPALHDGWDWTEAGRAYIERLKRLTGTRRKRLFQGIWAAGEGVWFETFDECHYPNTDEAEFDRRFPVHLAVDSGVHTGDVLFQVREGPLGPKITVFGNYYSFNKGAFAAAQEIKAEIGRRTGGRYDRGVTDPAGDSATGIGITVMGEYKRAGLILDRWPSYPGSVIDGLTLVDSFVSVDPPSLIIHPRCTHLISAFANYKRAKRQGQFIDRPMDPMHPHEELMDSLRGGLQDKFPAGRAPKPALQRAPARGGRFR